VLTGYQGWNSEALHDRMADAGRAGWARYLGFVSAEQLPLLFAGARLFVFPSLYEGFGLPVLEAMASGVPVVCSNASSLPEVAGGAAAMCDSGDVDALCRLILMGMEDDSWRNDAIKRGLDQAAKFSWQRCAKETIEAYQVALSI
jgi:glycosyltransferase involved in cell wall biosynthesis